MPESAAPCIAMESMPSIHDPDIGVHEVPWVRGTAEALEGYAQIVEDFDNTAVIIETWPTRGWRRVEPGTGNQGGIHSGDFEMRREGELMIAKNHAVGGHYVTGWFSDPATASREGSGADYGRILVREANYHPDGGQIFFPRAQAAFVALLAKPGDDIKPEDFVAFYCDGSFGIQLLPDVWHQPVFPVEAAAVFDDKQGAVHACVACDTVKEFGVYLSVPLCREDSATGRA